MWPVSMSLDISLNDTVSLCITSALDRGSGQLNAVAPLFLVSIGLETDCMPDTVWALFIIKFLCSHLFQVSVFVT
jgi:hypothetical protein